MKKINILFSLLLAALPVFSQQSACRQDTVYFYQNNYRGSLIWQTSTNGKDWTSIAGPGKDTIAFLASSTTWFRTEVTEGLCNPYYSDVVQLTVNTPPIVELKIKDSVCLNENAFILDGGTPAGGNYWGVGVVDGKFYARNAGIGIHKVFYRYRDPQTNCADTAIAVVQVTGLPNKATAGDDMPFIPADSVLLSANHPENGFGHWSIISGSNGHFSDPTSSNSWFIKDSANLDFKLKWTITGTCGNSSDEVNLTFFQVSKNPCPGAPTVTDADGNVYPTVQIGEQCWMAKNLNVGKFVRSSVNTIDHSNLANNGVIEKYCYANNPDSCKLYGGLYDWDEAMGYTQTVGAQGICPEGWHIPNFEDWNILDEHFTWRQAGYDIAIGGSSGFDSYYSGNRNASGDFYSIGSSAFFWVSADYVDAYTDEGYAREIAKCNGLIARKSFTKKAGFSIRCIKNK